MREVARLGEDAEVAQPERPRLEVHYRASGWGCCAKVTACHGLATWLVIRRFTDDTVVAEYACDRHVPADAREVHEAKA